MGSKLLEIGQALADHIDAGSFAIAAPTVAFTPMPVLAVEDLQTPHITVFPRSVSLSRDARGMAATAYEVLIILHGSVDGERDTLVNPFYETLEQLSEFVLTEQLTEVNPIPDAISVQPATMPEAKEFLDRHQFLGAMLATYVVSAELIA